MIWFTADTHFGHANIIRYTGRPFSSADEMDEALIHRWNDRVKPGDHVYHLGDVGLCSTERLAGILDRLKGQIHWIQGNHDKTAWALQDRFASVSPLKEIKVQDPSQPGKKRLVVLCHYALRVWNKSHHGSWHLYGHSHGELPELPDRLCLDVGVDCWDFAPVSLERVAERMATKRWVSPFADA